MADPLFPRNATGLEGKVSGADGCLTAAGMLAGAEACVGFEDQSAVLDVQRGTYYCLKLAAQTGANVQWSQNAMSAYIGLDEYGTGEPFCWFLDLLYVTAGPGRAVQVHSAVGDTSPVYYLRVRTPDGQLNRYIPIYAQHQA